MAEPQGFEETQPETPWCVQCGVFLKWPGYDECHGCLSAGGRPAATVSLRTVHWDTAVLHSVIRRKVAVWEHRHPGWVLVPDMQRYWEDSTHPSKYVDRETSVGRKLAWTRFTVERRHPRGRPNPWVDLGAGWLASWPPPQDVCDPYIEGVRVMSEPREPEPTKPTEPEDVPAPEPPAPGEPAEDEAPA